MLLREAALFHVPTAVDVIYPVGDRHLGLE
jgi:hypothetical protein